MRYSFVIILTILMACGTSRKALEAEELQEQILIIQKVIKPDFEQLIQIKNSINVQGRALTSKEIDFVKQVEAIESSYVFWKEKYLKNPKTLSQQRKSRDSLIGIKQKIESTLQMARTNEDK
ncbi:MAG: hypothetical protein IPJ74_04605 [Saprospiraceae bacterium]|nr:hypothetical protein [Saprospiraceae bacterium]